MRYALWAGIVVVLALTESVADEATYISAEDVEGALAALPADRFFVDQIRMLDAGRYNVGVGVAQRPATMTPTAIRHDQHTETYFILQGSGTFVSGGRLVDEEQVDPSGDIVRTLVGPSVRGSRIDGGVQRHVGPGDIVVVPEGTVHGFAEVQEELRYLVFRVDPDRQVRLK